MGKQDKKYFLIVDTESTHKIKGVSYCFDFAAVVIDKKGNILHKISCVIDDYKHYKLFHDDTLTSFFSRKSLEKRHQFYIDAMKKGEVQKYTVEQVNGWLDKVKLNYPGITLVAYNLQFDLNICHNSNIDLQGRFDRKLCLWALSCKLIAGRKGYIAFCMKNRFFSAKSVMKTSAETIYCYIINDAYFKEKHTAFEDVLIERNILIYLLKQKKSLQCDAYSWKKYALPIVAQRMGLI